MAVISWPAQLPRHVLREGYRQGMRDGRIFSKMDRGPPKSRRRSSANPAKVDAKLLVGADLLARFNRFWEEETAGGSLAFVLPDQIFDGAPLLDSSGNPLLDSSGNPLLMTSLWLVKFDEATPSITPWGPLFEITFSLLILP